MNFRFDTSRFFSVLAATLWIAPGCSGDTTSSNVTPGAAGTGASENGGSGNVSASSGGRVGAGGGSGSMASGGARAGGRSNAGGATTDASAGGSSGSDASAGASATGGRGGSGTGGSSGAVGATGGTSGAGAVTNSGGAAADAAGNTCGSQPCLSTRCAGWNCGPAVCCDLQNQPTCVHGTTACPGAGESSATLRCWSTFTDAYVFSRACTRKSDCFVAAHWMGCCNQHAIGMNVSEQSRFGSFEATCGGPPICGCCCDRVTADDGTVVDVGASFGVDCVSGLCTSSVL